ncbi:hypothetical protein M408DRAFT_30072 [Serendipita vermifera MAFF 305830]|uniref:Uncharacterized protein n=1 Tax=Serendipita vermifera MAFF 305830 TaxID=933852 RepID=A0A0C3ANF1_SERVB|nr:hypothetical protein M408DRAFT_30072 [Serendipita vermifera MAFF 305830]
MPVQSRLQFLKSIDGPDVINPFCWVKDVLHVYNSDGESTLSEDFYTTGGARKDIFVKLGRLHPLRQPDNPKNPRDNVAQVTVVGKITDIGTNFDVLGTHTGPIPVETFKLPNINWTIGLEVIDSNDMELLGIHQDQLYSVKEFGLVLESHQGGSKRLRRPINGKVPDGIIMLNFPPHFALGPAPDIVPSPRKRNGGTSSTTTAPPPRSPPPTSPYSPSSPGPVGTLYPTSQLPNFEPDSIPSNRLRLKQPAIFGSDRAPLHPASFKWTFTPGEIVRAIVEINALSLDTGLYGSMNIVEMHHVKVNFNDKSIPPHVESPIEEFDDEDDDKSVEGDKVTSNKYKVLVPGTPDQDDVILEDKSDAETISTVKKHTVKRPAPPANELPSISRTVSDIGTEEAEATNPKTSKPVKRKAGAQGGKKAKRVKAD